MAYSTKKPPYTFISFFFEVAEFFHLISCNENYSSVDVYYKHPGDFVGEGLDLKDYDLTDTSFKSWYDGGPNDAVGEWVGYLASGNATTTAAVNADSSHLVGKKVRVKFTARNGYVFKDGDSSAIYYLIFDSE